MITNIHRSPAPFPVPESIGIIARYPDGREVRDDMEFPLSQCGEDVLSKLCDRFRADIFAKAGKPDPRDMRELTLKSS